MFASRLAPFAAVVSLLVGLLGTAAPTRAAEPGPTVFAAASLKTALDEIAPLFAAEVRREAVVSYAAASALAKQIEMGAPADVFISADTAWMDYLAERGLIRPETRFDLLGNTLVLIGPPDAPEVKIDAAFDLAGLVGDGKIATGDVKSVPVGKYAKAALERLGLWAAVEPKIAGSENVRAALALVARGEAKYGIVYGSDAVSEPKVKVLGTFPPTSHPRIVYPVAITKGATNSASPAYLAFLKGPRAAKIFQAQGFILLR